MTRIVATFGLFLIAAPSVASASGAKESPEQLDQRMREKLEAVADNDVSKILYLNPCRGGCVFEPGQNDARLNTSTIVAGTSLVSEFRHSDETWQAVVQCVSEIYAPYDVEVTDQDPGQVFHHEAVVAGDYQEIGYETPIGGVAPSQCFPANNVISFTFANGYPPSPQTICAVIAQESAHSYGLEHAFDCSDPMTYLSACGRQFFRDKVAECGEFEPRNCQCGGSAQNSHRWLKMVLGANPDPVPGPNLSIVQPAEGEAVADGFNIVAEAAHMRGIGHVDLYINGYYYETLEATSPGNPYWFKAPASLSDGILDIEIRAYNDIESETIAMVTVTKGAPCGSAADCQSGQACDAGRCVWNTSSELGDACAADEECVTGECLSDASGEAYCTQECFPTSTENTCPSGFSCINIGGNDGRCWPESTGGGCGCAAGATPKSGAGAALLGLLVVVAARRRRRR